MKDNDNLSRPHERELTDEERERFYCEQEKRKAEVWGREQRSPRESFPDAEDAAAADMMGALFSPKEEGVVVQ